jgi:hypothetical protein
MSVAANEGAHERGLRARPEESALGVPMAAMAEALRMQAEAIEKIDRSQRKIAESIEKGDKAHQVITSTRALNETFKGLTEVQRGLLESIVRDRGRSRGLPFAVITIALLAGLLGLLVFERFSSDRTVPRAVFEQLRASYEDRADRLSELRATMEASSGNLDALRQQAAESDRRADALQRSNESLERKNHQLSEDLGAKESRLKNYLAVKDIADRVGTVELRNGRLEQENRALRGKNTKLAQERDNLLTMMGEQKIDARGRDPEKIKQAAQDQGVLPKKPHPAPTPDQITASTRRRLRRALNGLLQQAPGDEAYEVISFQGLDKTGTRLTDVKIARYRNARLLNSLHCKQLDILVDAAKDTAELRLRDGFISVNGRELPFEEQTHSIFLKKVGFKAWSERSQLPAAVGPDGRLAWQIPGRNG